MMSPWDLLPRCPTPLDSDSASEAGGEVPFTLYTLQVKAVITIGAHPYLRVCSVCDISELVSFICIWGRSDHTPSQSITCLVKIGLLQIQVTICTCACICTCIMYMNIYIHQTWRDSLLNSGRRRYDKGPYQCPVLVVQQFHNLLMGVATDELVLYL